MQVAPRRPTIHVATGESNPLDRSVKDGHPRASPLPGQVDGLDGEDLGHVRGVVPEVVPRGEADLEDVFLELTGAPLDAARG